jgi:hypothetical protein
VESQGHVETYLTCLEANLITGLLNDHFLAFVLLISVVKLWDLFDDPESLSVELLLQIGFEELSKFELVADCAVSQKISQCCSVIFDTHLRFLDEIFKLSVDLLSNFGVQFNKQTEKSQEINHSSNSQN